jgi:Tfp pilus assembly protein PilN
VTALRRLGWTTLGLWVLALALAGMRLGQEQNRIDRELARLKQPAAVLLALRQQLDQAALVTETIERSRAERGLVVGRLTALTAALPDSAYLTSLAIDLQGRGTATGGAPRATRVVAAWDHDGIAVGPRLAGPAVQEKVAGRERERFTITFGPVSR